MRKFAIVLGIVGLWNLVAAGEAHADPKWEAAAHSWYNSNPNCTYRMRLYVKVGAQIVQWPGANDFYDYTGPTTIYYNGIPYMYRWDRNQHQIDFGGLITPDFVWGEAEYQSLGSETWYYAGSVQYQLVQ